MDREVWHSRYLERLTVRGLSCDEAWDALKAGMGEHDYDECPEDMADDELSYWSE